MLLSYVLWTLRYIITFYCSCAVLLQLTNSISNDSATVSRQLLQTHFDACTT
jgi:uncharacterized membrane protein YgaE (UPF0421/DUF939 family)